MLDTKIISTITKQVEHQFPEVAGCKPSVRLQNNPQAKSAPSLKKTNQPLYLITYRGSANSASGNPIQRLVRVVVNSDGKIMKITTSR